MTAPRKLASWDVALGSGIGPRLVHIGVIRSSGTAAHTSGIMCAGLHRRAGRRRLRERRLDLRTMGAGTSGVKDVDGFMDVGQAAGYSRASG